MTDTKDSTQVTIGRLRTAIKYGTRESQLELLEKISSEVCDLELRYIALVNPQDLPEYIKTECEHENTIDLGDEDHQLYACTDCGQSERIGSDWKTI